MSQEYDKPAVEYFSKRQDYDKPAPEFFRKQGNEWTPVDSLVLHPSTPPSEVIGEWWIAWDSLDESERPRLEDFIAPRAAQWGADQELAACCRQLTDPEWYDEIKNLRGPFRAAELRAARRPKPPSLKEQALDDLRIAFDRGCLSGIQADTIRRALEQLPDHE